MGAGVTGADVNWLERPVTVRVPATSANLGPGFDALGLALARYDVVTARVIPDGVTITVTGTGQAAAIGAQPPGIALPCANQIPQGFGLGSSAGAIVAGLLAARALAGAAGAPALPDAAVLALATEFEGHP